MEVDLDRSPEVLQIAETLDVDEVYVVGMLWATWSMADGHASEEGRIEGGTKRMIDRRARHSGFADAMEKAGWLVVEENAIVFPKYQEHNGTTAKTRAQTQKRGERKRKRDAKETDVKRSIVTDALPEEKREEEIRKDSLEDHKCKGGDARGGPDGREPVGTSAPMADPSETENVTVYADPETWSDELIARVEQKAEEKFKAFKVTFDDRITLHRLAALVVGGVASEGWLADGVAATMAAIASNSIKKTHTDYVYGVLKNNYTGDYERLIAPVRLPKKLVKKLKEKSKRAPPRNG